MTHRYRAVTFDCFGTLIDWRRGQERVLQQFPSLREHQHRIREVMDAREPIEMRMEAGEYRSYASILSDSIGEACAQVLDVELTGAEKRAFAAGQLGWPAYADTVEGLRRLAAELPIGLLSNCDAQTLRLCAHKHLGAPISLFVSAEEVRSYKPAAAHWLKALELLEAGPQEVLHVSFTPAYDLHPAHALGFPLGFLRRYDHPEPADLPLAIKAEGLGQLVDRILALR